MFVEHGQHLGQLLEAIAGSDALHDAEHSVHFVIGWRLNVNNY